MSTGLRVLDAFSCKGGAGQGYLDAGCNVVGVDIKDYSDEYPGLFIQGDAVAFIRDYGRAFDLVHISAPCQPYTRGNAMRRVNGVDPRWPTLIDAARNAAIEAGVPYVIENVEDARSQLRNPILLCGRMFGLGATDTDGCPLILDRHRLFEFGNMPQPQQPAHPKHVRTSGIGFYGYDELELDAVDASKLAISGRLRMLTGQPHVAGVYGGARRDKWEAKYVRHGGYVPKDIRVLQGLLGVTHITTEHELFEAIPPAYTRWVVEAVSKGATRD